MIPWICGSNITEHPHGPTLNQLSAGKLEKLGRAEAGCAGEAACFGVTSCPGAMIKYAGGAWCVWGCAPWRQSDWNHSDSNQNASYPLAPWTSLPIRYVRAKYSPIPKRLTPSNNSENTWDEKIMSLKSHKNEDYLIRSKPVVSTGFAHLTCLLITVQPSFSCRVDVFILNY